MITTWLHFSVSFLVTSEGPRWGSIVATSWACGAPVELQSALLSWWWETAEVWAASPPLRTTLGDRTLPASLHPPPHPQWSSSQRERVWRVFKAEKKGIRKPDLTRNIFKVMISLNMIQIKAKTSEKLPIIIWWNMQTDHERNPDQHCKKYKSR